MALNPWGRAHGARIRSCPHRQLHDHVIGLVVSPLPSVHAPAALLSTSRRCVHRRTGLSARGALVPDARVGATRCWHACTP